MEKWTIGLFHVQIFGFAVESLIKNNLVIRVQLLLFINRLECTERMRSSPPSKDCKHLIKTPHNCASLFDITNSQTLSSLLSILLFEMTSVSQGLERHQYTA